MTQHTRLDRSSVAGKLVSGHPGDGLDERHQQLLDRTVAFAALLTSEGVLKHVSSNALAVSGLTREDVIGRPLWATCWWSHDPTGQERVRQAVETALAGQTCRFDTVVRTAQEGRITLDLQIAPITDSDGRVIELVASAVDISERVAAHEKLERLIQEMSHRIKNLLTTVRAMARMTQRTARPEQAFGDFAGRLEALTVAHEALSRTAAADEYFEYLAQRLLRPYRIAGVSRIAVLGPHVKLAPGEAKMLALCLYELATNAIKYGALANAEGRVAVMLSAPCGEQPASFSWVERGGPEVTPPSRQGYGTQFVTSSLEGIFGGKVTVDYKPEGLSVTVSGPAPGLFAGE